MQTAEFGHGDRRFSAEAAAAADLHLSVSPLRALFVLWGTRADDRIRLPVRRG